MKSFFKRVATGFCAGFMILTQVNAATSASLWNNNVYFEGQQAEFLNESGRPVILLSYNSSTFIPVRTAGEWMGKNVSWEQRTNTISISGSNERIIRQPIASTDEELTALETAREKGVLISPRPDISILVDGTKQAFRNARGEPVYPIMYENVTYLPLRNIGELLGMEVTWSHPVDFSEAIYIRTPLSEAQHAECRAYINTLLAQAQLAENARDALSRADKSDRAFIQSELASMENALNAMKSVKKPDVPSLSDCYDKMISAIENQIPITTKMQTSLKQNTDEYKTLLTATAFQNTFMACAQTRFMKGIYIQAPHRDSSPV